jgi:hypothetical protein
MGNVAWLVVHRLAVKQARVLSIIGKATHRSASLAEQSSKEENQETSAVNAGMPEKS